MPVGGYFLNMMLVFETSWHFWHIAQECQKWWESWRLQDVVWGKEAKGGRVLCFCATE